MSDFRRALAGSRPLLLDGGMGTMLQARGLPPGEQPERFCLQRTDILKSIHADYVRAGADVLLTCTFGGSRFKLPADMDVEAFNARMAETARSAAAEAGNGRRVFVAGDIGPSGHFPRPLGDVEPADMLAAYQEQVRGLVRGGVDLLFVETQFDLAEARLIAAAVRAECDLPLIVSMTFEQSVSLTGTRPETFAATMANMGVDAVGVNCGAGPEQMGDVVRRLLACSPLPVCAQPNAGLPELVGDATVFRLPPQAFAEATAAFAVQGVRLLGGCCGTQPEHIAALRQAVDSLGAVADLRDALSHVPGVSLTTRGSLVQLGGDAPLRIIGERINPTGKKVLQAELAAGQFDEALRFAAEQIAAGALVLDVNVGAPLVDETVVLPELVRQISARHVEPLSLDSSNAEAIAAALPYVSGSCLVNSINGEAGRMERLGPLCRQWGAPFILLPIQGKQLPVLARERIAIIERLLEQADALRIPRRLVAVDVLALSVASKAEAAREGLQTIRWCAEQGIPALIGLSNISFGLPARELVNGAFLSMCAGAGLSACIANPGSPRIREAVAASDVLLGKDEGAGRFVSGYARWSETAQVESAAAAAPVRATSLEQAVITGDRDHVTALVEAALAEGADPFELVRERLIPAITEVGARYERKEYFLPQLLRSAQTMQTAFARLKPLLEQRADAARQPVVVLATVEGDIHDIGKNIVGLMLGNHGFEVVDLGKDVRAEDIVDAAERHEAVAIGLSALMTTTMVRMEDTVRLVRSRGLKARVLIGGAVVTPAFAERIGADGYATDAVDAVRAVRRALDTAQASENGGAGR